jgi:hypothetical protein
MSRTSRFWIGSELRSRARAFFTGSAACSPACAGKTNCRYASAHSDEFLPETSPWHPAFLLIVGKIERPHPKVLDLDPSTGRNNGGVSAYSKT